MVTADRIAAPQQVAVSRPAMIGGRGILVSGPQLSGVFERAGRLADPAAPTIRASSGTPAANVELTVYEKPQTLNLGAVAASSPSSVASNEGDPIEVCTGSGLRGTCYSLSFLTTGELRRAFVEATKELGVV